MRNGTLVDNIKAAYLYYPLSYDPSEYTDGELLLFNEASENIAAGTFRESDYTAAELALINGVKRSDGSVEKVVRFFCYVGIPDGASLSDPDSYAGIVCTHNSPQHAFPFLQVPEQNVSSVSLKQEQPYNNYQKS